MRVISRAALSLALMFFAADSPAAVNPACRRLGALAEARRGLHARAAD